MMIAAVLAQTIPPTGVNIAWDVNLTTILTFVGGSIVFYMGVVQMRVKQQLLEKKHEELDKRLADFIAAHNALSHQLQAFKEQIQNQLQSFVTWDAAQQIENRLAKELNKTEERLSRSIEGIGKRIDRMYSPKHED